MFSAAHNYRPPEIGSSVHHPIEMVHVVSHGVLVYFSTIVDYGPPVPPNLHFRTASNIPCFGPAKGPKKAIFKRIGEKTIVFFLLGASLRLAIGGASLIVVLPPALILPLSFPPVPPSPLSSACLQACDQGRDEPCCICLVHIKPRRGLGSAVTSVRRIRKGSDMCRAYGAGSQYGAGGGFIEGGGGQCGHGGSTYRAGGGFREG